MKFRPWGPLKWAIDLGDTKNWNFIGAIGTEERSLCCWALLRSTGNRGATQILHINDMFSANYDDDIQVAFSARYEEFDRAGGARASIQRVDLMTELYQIQDIAKQAVNAGSSVVLDITSMPKRFFFPLMKTLVSSAQVENLLITYSSPETYADGAIYENPEKWRNLPGFGGGEDSGRESLIVSVGFLVESLSSYLAENKNLGKIQMLIPFPAPLAVLRRTWESIANLERFLGVTRFDKYRVETSDMSSAFDRIVSLAEQQESPPVAFAPFGPKPTSAAMCLYAIQKGSSVYYPQPTIYHPEYSIGIRNNDPETAVSAYWVKYEGENLYAI